MTEEELLEVTGKSTASLHRVRLMGRLALLVVSLSTRVHF